MLFSSRLINSGREDVARAEELMPSIADYYDPGLAGGLVGSAESFAKKVTLRPLAAVLSCVTFITVVALAAFNVADIAACAFAGAVVLIMLRVISADEAYNGLRADVLMLIAGMVLLGIALKQTGLAKAATAALIGSMHDMSPLLALTLLYGITLVATEILSNAAVAVLFTPVALSMAEAFSVSPRPFLVAVMIAASAAFATPFGYQTNVMSIRWAATTISISSRSACPSTSSPGQRRSSRSKSVFRFEAWFRTGGGKLSAMGPFSPSYLSIVGQIFNPKWFVNKLSVK